MSDKINELQSEIDERSVLQKLPSAIARISFAGVAAYAGMKGIDLGMELISHSSIPKAGENMLVLGVVSAQIGVNIHRLRS